MINLNYVFHPGSCGYFCLKFIFKKIKLKKKSYLSLYDIKKEFVKQNYSCLCFRLRNVFAIKSGCVTLINTKNNYHYVVVKKVEKEYVILYDPLFLFERKVKIVKFMKKWSGICLFYKKI